MEKRAQLQERNALRAFMVHSAMYVLLSFDSCLESHIMACDRKTLWVFLYYSEICHSGSMDLSTMNQL